MPSDRAVALAAQWATEAALITGGETVAAGHRHSQSDIDDLLLALQSRLSTAQLGQPSGVAPLDANAKVPVVNLPDISTTRGVFPVASQAAMLSLNAQVGAVAVRSDLNGQSYILAALPASNLSNWLSQSPPGTVTSVNGQTGAVTIPVPAVATTTTDGLMPAGDRLILSGQGAADTQVLRRVGGVIVWANPVIWTVRTSNATLGVNEACAANSGVTELTLPSTASGGHEILNNTAATITIWRGGTATISGIARSTGAAIAATDRVRILPGQRGTFVASGGDWIAQGCEPPFLAFAYNGTPLAGNPSNPGGAADLIHFLGGVNTFVNPATNGTIAVAASSTASSAGSAAVTTDRVANPSAFSLNWQANNLANSWIAWQFPASFAPTGLLLQTAGYANNYHLRSFRIHYSNDLSADLTSSSPVSTWTQGPGWTNQTQITGAGTWHFFPFSAANTNPTGQLPQLRRLAIFVTGPTSDGANYPTICEINWFGDWFGV